MELSKDVISRKIKDRAFWEWNDSEFHVQTSESGLHSDLYLNTDEIIADILLVEDVVKNIFSKEIVVRDITPDWIITYPPFGIAIAYALARHVGARFGYVDIKAGVCNFNIEENEKVIIVGDDIYSGGSLKKTVKAVEMRGAKIDAPIFTIGNFSGVKDVQCIEILSVISERGNLYAEKECPMCKSGSEAVLPRPNWAKLMKK